MTSKASMQASRQAGRQAIMQAIMQASWQAGNHAGNHAGKQTGKWTGKHAGNHTRSKKAGRQASTRKAFSRSHALEGLVYEQIHLKLSWVMSIDEGLIKELTLREAFKKNSLHKNVSLDTIYQITAPPPWTRVGRFPPFLNPSFSPF